VQAVLFDLDDTLVPQAPWLSGAWQRVADAGAQLGADPDALLDSLLAVASEGSDRGAIIDRSLALCGAEVPVGPLVQAFWTHRPDGLECYPGALASLRRLASRVPIGIVTDGNVELQRYKVDAAGLAPLATVLVYSDQMGRHRRKPAAAPFLEALRLLDMAPEAVVFVGDRPDKDVLGAQRCGMRTVRVMTGEYCRAADEPAAWLTAPDVVSAISMLERQWEAGAR
jgi:putative hydrolase of the HAD superfamily